VTLHFFGSMPTCRPIQLVVLLSAFLLGSTVCNVFFCFPHSVPMPCGSGATASPHGIIVLLFYFSFVSIVRPDKPKVHVHARPGACSSRHVSTRHAKGLPTPCILIGIGKSRNETRRDVSRLSDNTARHARHAERDTLDMSYVSRRDVTIQVEFGL